MALSKIRKSVMPYKSWDRTEITRLNFEGGEQLLNAAGVETDAKILVLDAYTTNVPLILLARKDIP